MANINISSGVKSNKVNLAHQHSLKADLVYMNDGIRVCTEACACCWDKPIPEKYTDKAEYLGKRASTGHTSVFEHSNLVILVTLPDLAAISTEDFMHITDALANCKYLNAHINNKYLVIGGSYRGYDELFKRVHYVSDARNNTVLNAIAKVLYQNIDSRVFADLIKEGILSEESFINVEPDPVSKFFNQMPEKPFYEDDKIKIVSVDNINMIRKNLDDLIGETNTFNDWELTTLASLTILFKNMSRTGTHQLVRHRNAITQESQRYVDYSNAAFADPCEFKPDKYDANKIYTINFGGKEFNMTSMEIGEAICGIYQNMLNQGMMKEDARAFLPGNVKCRKLYMTFTYSTYMKFLELRAHPAAQAEIRSFAIDCKDATTSIFEDLKDKADSGVDVVLMTKDEMVKTIIDATPELATTDKEENKDA